MIELLADREMETFAKWLGEHPDVEVISRDRGSSYTHAATKTLPNAIQVADRFHLKQNLVQTLERIMRRYYPQITQLLGDSQPQMTAAALPAQTNTLEKPSDERETELAIVANTTGANAEAVVVPTTTTALPLKRWDAEKVVSQEKRMALYHQVMELVEAGYNHRAIATQLGIGTGRIRQFLQGPPVPPVYTKRPTKLDGYREYLQKRFYEEGCDNALKLYREIKGQGYSGASGAVSSYVTQLRQQRGDKELTKNRPKTQPTPLPEREKQLSPRQLAWWFALPLERLKLKQREGLAQLKASEPQLAEVYELSQTFNALLHSGSDAGFSEWLKQAALCGIAELKSFSKGLEKDEAAVRAGLKLRWSQGKTEGKINKLKLIKRQGYGRAEFDLLRMRMLAKSA